MSETLRAIFSPEHIIFRKECQCKIKILSFCLGFFDRINLSKRDIHYFLFKFIVCYAKTGLKKDNVFQLLDSKKDFQKAHEKIKDCLLIYYFL